MATVFEAFITLQSKLPEIEKNKEVDVKGKDGKFLYKFKYADLNGIIKVLRPLLFEYGLGFTQYMIQDEKLGLCYATKFMHKSGQWLETGYTPVPVAVAENAEMRDVGGIATYGQRLSLKAALGLSAEDDNDGPNRKNEETTPLFPKEPPQMTDQQRGIALNNLLSSFRKIGVSEAQIKKHFKTQNVYHISDQQINELAALGQQIQANKTTANAIFGERK